ncbi:MAG: hypothetical protein WBW46_00475 [Candidatus Sulfotelmatobacter sp.]
MAAPCNKYSVAQRLAMLENGQTELRRDLNAAVWKEGKPGRDGRNGVDGVCKCKEVIGPEGRPGRDGASIVGPKGDSIVGPQGPAGQSIVGPPGPKGDPGDFSIVGPEELLVAVRKLKQKNAQWQAAWMSALVKNSSRRHPGLKSAVDSVLQKLRAEAEQ